MIDMRVGEYNWNKKGTLFYYMDKFIWGLKDHPDKNKAIKANNDFLAYIEGMENLKDKR
jgi:hypothetical protein